MTEKGNASLSPAPFVLSLRSPTSARQAHFFADRNELIWSDTGEAIFENKADPQPSESAFPLSPENPAGKSSHLFLIKVQVGFGCNMKCKYCSQAGLRPSARELKGSLEDAAEFLKTFGRWYAGGKNGRGRGTRVEFWGGETLLYWPAVKELIIGLRTAYDDLDLLIFTNGSLINDEIIAIAEQYRVHVAISHDGQTSGSVRGRDPLTEPKRQGLIRTLFEKLNPRGLISFNATITAENHSLVSVQADIASKLGVPFHQVQLTYELAMPYDETALQYLFSGNERAIRTLLFIDTFTTGMNGLQAGGLWRQINQIQEMLERRTPAASLSQHCGMDREDRIAVDLKGRVITCQNTTASGGHQIGSVQEFEKISLNTSYHWSQRPECQRCPVVSSCRGACMFLRDSLFKGACDQFFHWQTTLLAIVLYLRTGMVLEKIEGDRIRNQSSEETVLSLEDVQVVYAGEQEKSRVMAPPTRF